MDLADGHWRDSERMKIAVFALGHDRLSNAVLLAHRNEVVAEEITPERVAMLNARRSPIVDTEPELAETPLNFVATVDSRRGHHYTNSGVDYGEHCRLKHIKRLLTSYSDGALVRSDRYKVLSRDRGGLQSIERQNLYPRRDSDRGSS